MMAETSGSRSTLLSGGVKEALLDLTALMRFQGAASVASLTMNKAKWAGTSDFQNFSVAQEAAF